MRDALYIQGDPFCPSGWALQYFVAGNVLTYRVISAAPQTGRPLSGAPDARRIILEEKRCTLPEADQHAITFVMSRVKKHITRMYRFPKLDVIRTEADAERTFAHRYAEVYLTMHELVREVSPTLRA